MSSFRVLAVASEGLRRLLWNSISARPGDPASGRHRGRHRVPQPDGTAQDSARRLSLWLYHVCEDEHVKNATAVTLADGSIRMTPLALDLYYLLTPFATTGEADHLLLGKAMQTFHDTATARVVDATAGDVNEELRITLFRRSLDEISQVWQALREPYRLSVCYQVKVTHVDSERRRRRGPRHRRQRLVGRPSPRWWEPPDERGRRPQQPPGRRHLRRARPLPRAAGGRRPGRPRPWPGALRRDGAWSPPAAAWRPRTGIWRPAGRSRGCRSSSTVSCRAAGRPCCAPCRLDDRRGDAGLLAGLPESRLVTFQPGTGPARAGGPEPGGRLPVRPGDDPARRAVRRHCCGVGADEREGIPRAGVPEARLCTAIAPTATGRWSLVLPDDLAGPAAGLQLDVTVTLTPGPGAGRRRPCCPTPAAPAPGPARARQDLPGHRAARLDRVGPRTPAPTHLRRHPMSMHQPAPHRRHHA